MLFHKYTVLGFSKTSHHHDIIYTIVYTKFYAIMYEYKKMKWRKLPYG